VVPVPYYLALCAYDEGPWRPIAVRVADEVVSFVMWGVDSTDGGYWIGGLIIDRRHQRRGYGRAAVLGCWNGPLWRGIAKPRATTRRTAALGPCTQTWASSRPASSKTAKP
jgi:hypothetical protein